MVDEEVTAVVLAVLMVVGVLALSQTGFTGKVLCPFSELAVLGANKKIGYSPKELVAGETLNLYLYLGNHEGKIMYYRVLVKLGDRASNVNDTKPLDAPILASYEYILRHGENQTIPVIQSLPNAGLGKRLVFELHVYDRESNSFEYRGRWCQLWLNVTLPPS